MVSIETTPLLNDTKTEKGLGLCGKTLSIIAFLSLLLIGIIFIGDSVVNRDLTNVVNVETSKPNIIWIIADDLGHSDVSYNGGDIETQAIDNLVENGIKLTSHYTQPLCSPARTAFLTGRYPFRSGIQETMSDNIKPGAASHLPTKYGTIANYLKFENYNTRIYGKWHQGYAHTDYIPTSRGFDYHMGFYSFAIDYWTKYAPDKYPYYDWWENGETNDDTMSVYSSYALTNKIVNDISDYTWSNPFFMYVALQNPHWTVEDVPDSFQPESCDSISDSRRKLYCRHTKILDDSIDKIVKSLKDNSLYDNTLILLSGDNGALSLDLCGNPGLHSAAGSMYPYRGGKYTLFEGGVLTPAFISGGYINKNYRGTESNNIMHGVDWLPTIMHIVQNSDNDINNDNDNNNNDDDDTLIRQYDNNIEDELDGINQYYSIFENNNEKYTREYLILNLDYDDEKNDYINTAIIYNNYKLIYNHQLTLLGSSCDIRSASPFSESFDSIINNDLLNTEDMNNMYLFNLIDDPYEYTDLLNGNGKNDDNYSNYQSLINKMFEILNTEKQNGFVSTQDDSTCQEGLNIAQSTTFWAPWTTGDNEVVCTSVDR